jgi:cytochrome c peroxidase
MQTINNFLHICSRLWAWRAHHLSRQSTLQRSSRYGPPPPFRSITRISTQIPAGATITYLNILLSVCSWLFAGLLASSLSILFSSAPAAVAPPPSDTLQTQAVGEEPITPIPPPPAADPRRLALGERLFNDPRLSSAGNIACSSCHDLRTNGADDTEHREEAAGSKFNTLTVFNSALSFRLNWKGRFHDLAEQAESSIESNMHSSLAEVAQRLDSDPETVSQFRVAYERDPDRDNILDALVTFERSLLTPDSRFDRWLRGDTSALTPDELEGYGTFKSLGCISCHQGVNVGGNLFQRVGIFHPLGRGPAKIMRVPSLRNVAATAPYFHDGSAPTLEEAVRRMGSAQLDRDLTNQQVASLVSFLNTLTGNYRSQPVAGDKP